MLRSHVRIHSGMSSWEVSGCCSVCRGCGSGGSPVGAVAADGADAVAADGGGVGARADTSGGGPRGKTGVAGDDKDAAWVDPIELDVPPVDVTVRVAEDLLISSSRWLEGVAGLVRLGGIFLEVKHFKQLKPIKEKHSKF